MYPLPTSAAMIDQCPLPWSLEISIYHAPTSSAMIDQCPLPLSIEISMYVGGREGWAHMQINGIDIN
jgi:hypothetical protein